MDISALTELGEIAFINDRCGRQLKLNPLELQLMADTGATKVNECDSFIVIDNCIIDFMCCITCNGFVHI